MVDQFNGDGSHFVGNGPSYPPALFALEFAPVIRIEYKVRERKMR
jgi:hypothetical protein